MAHASRELAVPPPVLRELCPQRVVLPQRRVALRPQRAGVGLRAGPAAGEGFVERRAERGARWPRARRREHSVRAQREYTARSRRRTPGTLLLDSSHKRVRIAAEVSTHARRQACSVSAAWICVHAAGIRREHSAHTVPRTTARTSAAGRGRVARRAGALRRRARPPPPPPGVGGLMR